MSAITDLQGFLNGQGNRAFTRAISCPAFGFKAAYFWDELGTHLRKYFLSDSRAYGFSKSIPLLC